MAKKTKRITVENEEFKCVVDYRGQELAEMN